MVYRVLAVLGGLLFLRWPRAAWVHVPVALWGTLIVWIGWVCPLTPLELWLRQLGGEAGYEGSFVEHYIVPLIHPDWMTPYLRINIGLFVLAINVLVYAWGWYRHKSRSGLDLEI